MRELQGIQAYAVVSKTNDEGRAGIRQSKRNKDKGGLNAAKIKQK